MTAKCRRVWRVYWEATGGAASGEGGTALFRSRKKANTFVKDNFDLDEFRVKVGPMRACGRVRFHGRGQ